MRTFLAVVLLVTPLVCSAGPLVTITCEQLRGTTQNYGVTPAEAIKAASDHKPRPSNHLAAPLDDGFSGKPTFVVDSNRQKLTLVWPPDAARELPVVRYSPLVITALDAHPGRDGVAMLYSFYPKLGIVFVAQHYLDTVGPYASQGAFFAKCEYSWSGEP